MGTKITGNIFYQKIYKFFLGDSRFSRLLVLLIAILLFALCTHPGFFSKASILSITKQCPEYGIMAVGLALTMIVGGIDLSIVGVANLSSMLAVLAMRSIAPTGADNVTVTTAIITGIFVALAVGFVAGILNGILCSKIGIPPILATLGVQQICYGLAIVISGGEAVKGVPPVFSEIGTKVWYRLVATQFFVFVIVAILIGILLSKTNIGVKMLLFGTNNKAFKFVGYKSGKTIILAHLLSSILAAIAGLIMLARNSSTKASYGEAYIMQCILVAVLGGTISSLFNRFQGINTFYRQVIWGVTLILVMVTNEIMDEKKRTKSNKKSNTDATADHLA